MSRRVNKETRGTRNGQTGRPRNELLDKPVDEDEILKEVLEMHPHGISQKEIAALYNVSDETIRKTEISAVEKLKSGLKDWWMEVEFR